MKKLMITLAAVAVATIAQAASVTWQFTASACGDNPYPNSTVYLFDTATFNAGVDALTKAISEDLLDSALDSSALYYASGKNAAQLYKTGKSATDVATRRIDGLDDGTLNWSAVMVTDNDGTMSYQILSTGSTATYDPESQSATKATKTLTMVAINAIESYSVTTSGVPEPTSGLLLLLGLAGIALRRKQA
ncbi:MAG: PEP-CTERM sorting domain-containing protein [Bacteroidales bacterium]|nr:PEP-CTERM sorting domain-containing protein [Candidatus Colimorpha pelethequi]